MQRGGGDWPALRAAPSLADGRQTNPNDGSGKHFSPFTAKSASLGVAKKPFVVRVDIKEGQRYSGVIST